MATPQEIAARNTEQDTPSQNTVGMLSNPADTVMNVTQNLYGGDIPSHSQHWADYFGGDMFASPLGNKNPLAPRPQAENVMVAVAEPQQLATAGGTDPWVNAFHLFTGTMRNGSNRTPV